MIFFLCLCISIVYAYCVGTYYLNERLSLVAFCIILFPLFSLWTLISGLQYYVGQDYPYYIEIFSGINNERYEPGFKLIIQLCNIIGIKGQGVYFIFYAISFIFFALILYNIKSYDLWIYILLYFTVSNIFNNELNIIRQCTAIYIGSYSLILLFKNRIYKAILFWIIACFIHTSLVVLIIAPLFYFINKINIKFFLIILLLSIVLSILLSIRSISSVAHYLPENYGWYLVGHINDDSSFVEKIPKYMYVPLYYFSYLFYPKLKLDPFMNHIYRYGFLFFCFRLSLLNLPIVYRLSDNFLLISLFPLLYMLSYFQKSRKYVLLTIIVIFLVLIYGAKTIIFPSGEYDYKSILPVYIF